MSRIDTRATKRTREEQTRATRDALMNAALRVVSQYGYAKASVSRITEAAGVAQGTFYSYFNTHQKLLEELLPSEGARLLALLGREARGSEDYFDHERRAFLAFFKYLRRNPYFLRVLTEAEIAAPASHSAHMSNVDEHYLGALRRAQERGQIRPQSDASFRVIAEVLSGSRGHIAIGLDQQGAGAARTPADAVETYVKFVRMGLGDALYAQTQTPAPRKKSARASPLTDTRTALLRATARLAYEKGYEATTVAGITQAANVAVGTFYAHFQSRQRLLDEVLAHVRTEMLGHVGESLRGAESFVEVECRGFLGFFDYLSANPWYLRIETEAAVWASESYTRHFNDLTERYVLTMKRSKAAGQMAAYEEHEFPTLACIFMAARHYLATRFILSRDGPNRLPASVARTYLDLVRFGLQPR